MKSNSVRAAGIVLAVILGVAALLYLGGLISQLTIGYQKWLADGGMTGKATMGAIYFSPLVCWRSAMTGSGLKCTLFTAVLAGGLFVFVRLQNRFGSNDYDPRNFTRSKRGTYGTSGWMSEKEMRSVLEVAGPERAKGIILGKTERGSVICLPEDTRLNKHIAVFGASGTMKSRGVIRPALFQSIRRGESVVVADPKSEMFADTAELFKKHGYKVRVYNLLQPEYSDSWNCMFDLGGDTLMAQILTDVIISNTKGDEKGDHFWDNGESNLLKSLILYVDLDSTRTPEERNLAAVYQMLTQHTEKELTMLFDRLPIGHPAKGPRTACSARPATPCAQASSWALAPDSRCSRARPCGGSPAAPTSTCLNRAGASAPITSSWTIRTPPWSSCRPCSSHSCSSSSCATPTAPRNSAARCRSTSSWTR